MDLTSVPGTSAVQAIDSAGQIVFHTVGDTGGVIKPEAQFAIAEAMADDITSGTSGVAFWYHLGDVVYYCGQEQYYFEQFYDPFTGETAKSLDAFVENFCAAAPAHNPDSQGVSRTTMDQTGVYFTLNAPFTGSPSGHAYQYERYTRTVGGKTIPFIVAGMGGYYNLTGLKVGNKNSAPKTPMSGTDASNNPLTLEAYNDNTFGFLRMTVSPTAISGVLVSVDQATGKTGIADSFTVDLKAGTLVNKSTTQAKKAPAKSEKFSGSRKPKKISTKKRRK